MKPSKWIDEINRSIGKNFQLETTDGVVRHGRITGLTHKEFKYNDENVTMPTEIEVNGDPNDRIPLDRLNSLKIR